MVKRLKIVNFILDEKFIDSLIGYQDTAQDVACHDYVLVYEKAPIIYKYIKTGERVTQTSAERVIDFIKENGYDAVRLHALYSLPLRLIPLIPADIPVLWSSWGYDLYRSETLPGLIHKELYGPYTRRLFHKTLLSEWYHRFRGWCWELRNCRREDTLLNQYKRAVARVDYMSCVLPNEYDLIHKGRYGFRAKPFRFSYSDINKCMSAEDVSLPECYGKGGKNILVGNSSSFENNHIEVFVMLSRMDLEGRRVIVPLSYGNDRYRSVVMEKGRELLGDKFEPILTFMPFDEYKRVLESCEVAIFNHERQQALGNVSTCIKLGIKVFLSHTSVAYDYYMKSGVKVHSIQKELTSSDAFTHESKEIVLSNLRNMEASRVYSYEEKLKWLHTMYGMIRDHSKQK